MGCTTASIIYTKTMLMISGRTGGPIGTANTIAIISVPVYFPKVIKGCNSMGMITICAG